MKIRGPWGSHGMLDNAPVDCHKPAMCAFNHRVGLVAVHETDILPTNKPSRLVYLTRDLMFDIRFVKYAARNTRAGYDAVERFPSNAVSPNERFAPKCAISRQIVPFDRHPFIRDHENDFEGKIFAVLAS